MILLLRGWFTALKDANILISSGDMLDIKSNNILMAFIQGMEIDLDNHQKQLYRKFQEKYRRIENGQN
jgi:hypothetical protein